MEKLRLVNAGFGDRVKGYGEVKMRCLKTREWAGRGFKYRAWVNATMRRNGGHNGFIIIMTATTLAPATGHWQLGPSL